MFLYTYPRNSFCKNTVLFGFFANITCISQSPTTSIGLLSYLIPVIHIISFIIQHSAVLGTQYIFLYSLTTEENLVIETCKDSASLPDTKGVTFLNLL